MEEDFPSGMLVKVDGVEQRRGCELHYEPIGGMRGFNPRQAPRFVPTVRSNERLIEFVDGRVEIITVKR